MSHPRISLRSRIVLVTLIGLTAAGSVLFHLSHRQPPLKPLMLQEQRNKDLISAIYSMDPARVHLMLRAGADPNSRGSISWNERGDWSTQRHEWVWDPRSNRDGPTALMLAGYDRENDAVRALIQRGADINARDHEGNSALIYAGSSSIACTLLAHGADVAPNHYGENPLTFAADFSDIRPAQQILAHGAPVECRNAWGETPLLMAASNLNPSMVRLLLSKRATVDARDSDGDTPLLLALGGGSAIPPDEAVDQRVRISPTAQKATVKLLLDAGANVTVRDPQGRTPLQLATGSGLIPIVSLLRDAGAKS